MLRPDELISLSDVSKMSWPSAESSLPVESAGGCTIVGGMTRPLSEVRMAVRTGAEAWRAALGLVRVEVVWGTTWLVGGNNRVTSPPFKCCEVT